MTPTSLCSYAHGVMAICCVQNSAPQRNIPTLTVLWRKDIISTRRIMASITVYPKSSAKLFPGRRERWLAVNSIGTTIPKSCSTIHSYLKSKYVEFLMLCGLQVGIFAYICSHYLFSD